MTSVLTHGIVLSSANFSDYDQIITILSKEYGKFSLLARGVNKLSSKNKYSLGTFNYSSFEFFKTTKVTGLSKLKTSMLIKDYNLISHNYQCYQYASALSYLVETSLELWHPNRKLYQNFCLVLDDFNQNRQVLKSFVYFLFYGLPNFGGPMINATCRRCGSKRSSYALYHLYDLALICANCQSNNEKQQDPEWIQFITRLNEINLDQALDWEINEQFIIILGKILLTYYRETLGFEAKVLQLIDQKPIFNSITNDLINFLLQY